MRAEQVTVSDSYEEFGTYAISCTVWDLASVFAKISMADRGNHCSRSRAAFLCRIECGIEVVVGAGDGGSES